MTRPGHNQQSIALCDSNAGGILSGWEMEACHHEAASFHWYTSEPSTRATARWRLESPCVRAREVQGTMTDPRVQILDKTVCYDGFFRIERYRLRHELFRGGWSR